MLTEVKRSTKTERYFYALVATMFVAVLGSFVIMGNVIMVNAQNSSGNGTVVVTEESFVNTVWGTLQAGFAFYTVISGIAIFLALKVRGLLKNSKAEWAKKLVQVLDHYIIPAFKETDKFVEVTKKQETKIKQLGEILYQFMGPEADKIRDKYSVRLQQLQEDLEQAEVGSIEFKQKLQNFVELLEQIKAEAGAVA